MSDTSIAKAELLYNGALIHAKADRLSLTDMWKAAGGDDLTRPSRWLELDGTKQFIECVAAQNVGQGDIIAAERGRNGGTWAHWQIGLAYAKYLSPEFHMWANSVVRSVMEGRTFAAPDVATLASLLEAVERTALR